MRFSVEVKYTPFNGEPVVDRFVLRGKPRVGLGQQMEPKVLHLQGHRGQRGEIHLIPQLDGIGVESLGSDLTEPRPFRSKLLKHTKADKFVRAEIRKKDRANLRPIDKFTTVVLPGGKVEIAHRSSPGGHFQISVT